MAGEELVSIKKTIQEKLDNDDLVIPIEFMKDNNSEIIKYAAKVLDEVDCELDVVRCNVLSTDDETTYVLSANKIDGAESVIISARKPNKSKQPLDILEVLRTISENVWSDVDNYKCVNEDDTVDNTNNGITETKQKCEDEVPSSQKEKLKPKPKPKDALSNMFKNMATKKATNPMKSPPKTQNKNGKNSQNKLAVKDNKKVKAQEEPELDKDPFESEESDAEEKMDIDDDDEDIIKKKTFVRNNIIDDDDDDDFDEIVKKDIENNVEKDVEMDVGNNVEKEVKEDKKLPIVVEEKTEVKEDEEDDKNETILYQDEDGYFVSTKKTTKKNKPVPSTSQKTPTKKRKSPDPEFTRVTRRTPKKEDKAKGDKRSINLEIDDEQPTGKRRRTAKAEPAENTKGGKGKGNSKKSTANQPKILTFFKKS